MHVPRDQPRVVRVQRHGPRAHDLPDADHAAADAARYWHGGRRRVGCRSTTVSTSKCSVAV